MASNASFYSFIINTRHTYTCSFSSHPSWFLNVIAIITAEILKYFTQAGSSLEEFILCKIVLAFTIPVRQAGSSHASPPSSRLTGQRRPREMKWLAKVRASGYAKNQDLCAVCRGPAASQEGRKWGVLWPGFGTRKLESAGIRITESYIELGLKSQLIPSPCWPMRYQLERLLVTSLQAKLVGGNAETRTNSSRFQSIVLSALQKCSP